MLCRYLSSVKTSVQGSQVLLLSTGGIVEVKNGRSHGWRGKSCVDLKSKEGLVFMILEDSTKPSKVNRHGESGATLTRLFQE